MSRTRAQCGQPFLALALLAPLVLAPLQAADEKAALNQKALQLNLVTGDDPMTGQIVALLEDADNSKKLLAAARKLVKDQKDQPFNINAAYILARTAAGLKDVETGRLFYDIYNGLALKLESGQKLAQGYVGLIQMLYDAKQFAESIKICNKFLEMENDDEMVERLKPRVERLMIMALARQGQSDEALKILDRLIKKAPDNWLNLELKGRVLREIGQLEESARIYEDIIDQIRKDQRLKKDEREEFAGDLRYALSAVYVDLKQIDKAAEHLKALLAREPNNPTYNNDLGYIWADHDMKLDESEKLIRKALDEDRKQKQKEKPDLKPEEFKDNPSFLDSLGWVLFKQKKYKEAKPYLVQAVEQEDGKHLEIYDHLGDVYWALGEKAEAVAAWKKGLEISGTSSRENKRKAEVEKKVKDRQ